MTTSDKLSSSEAQLLRDRAQPEFTQAKGHNQRIKVKYPTAWANSLITNDSLAEWITDHKGQPCVYCDEPSVEVDHIVPLAHGGEHAVGNLQMLCMLCNRQKGEMNDTEFRDWKSKQPKQIKIDLGETRAAVHNQLNAYRSLRTLFSETHRGRGLPPYSLRAEGHGDGILSIYRLYLDIGDPTEYRVAVDGFGSIKIWDRLTLEPWFRVHLERWRDELKAKIKSELVTVLIQEAKDGNLGAIKQALVDSAFVFNPYVDPNIPIKNRVGRPANPEVDNTIPDSILSEDSLRIGLN